MDDLIIYMINRERFLLVVNSSNRQKDFEWILEHGNKQTGSLSSSVSIEDVTDSMALLALQGPLAQKVLQEVVADINFDLIKPFNLLNAKLFGVECIISRQDTLAKMALKSSLIPQKYSSGTNSCM